MNAQPHTPPSIEMRSYPDEYHHHRHTYHQVVLPLAGALEVDTGAGARCVGGSMAVVPAAGGFHSGTRPANEATAVVIPAGEAHGFAGRGENRFIVVDLPANQDARLFDRALHEPAIRVDRATRHHVTFLAERLVAGPLAETFRRHWTALLLEALDSPVDVVPPRADTKFDRAVQWIADHLDRPLGTRDVAAAVAVSPSRLRALFRARAGCTPRGWIDAARLDRAAELVATTDRPLSEIALACGFSEQSAFTRAFVRRFGEPPGRRRRRTHGLC